MVGPTTTSYADQEGQLRGRLTASRRLHRRNITHSGLCPIPPGTLTLTQPCRAFIEPIHSPGGHNVESALEKATAASQSYPYFIQQQGQAIWNSATQQIITDDDVLAAGLYGAGNTGLRTETGGNSLGRRNRFLPENLSMGHHEDGSG